MIIIDLIFYFETVKIIPTKNYEGDKGKFEFLVKI